MIKIVRKITLAVALVLMTWSDYKFAHVTTVELSWHVQNFDLIKLLLFMQEQHIYLEDLDYGLIGYLWNGSQCTCNMHYADWPGEVRPAITMRGAQGVFQCKNINPFANWIVLKIDNYLSALFVDLDMVNVEIDPEGKHWPANITYLSSQYHVYWCRNIVNRHSMDLVCTKYAVAHQGSATNCISNPVVNIWQ